MDKIVLLNKAYSLYNALRKSEEKILNCEEPWREDLQFSRWDWRQGVGFYGIWNLYKITKDEDILKYIIGWIDRRIEEGQPLEKHINTVCPMLTVASLYEETKDEKYLPLIEEWVAWILDEENGLPRTNENGLSHYCGVKSPNTQQLWDDTLFMTVLFLAKAGMILNKKEYVEQAYYQFIVHAKYLTDYKTGLWYHAYTFNGNHAFSQALWGRGNSWVTASIPEFLEIVELDDAYVSNLARILRTQVETLKNYQDESGLWHTLLNERDSYLETTGSAGFSFGIKKAVRLGIIPQEYLECANKGLKAIVDNIDEKGYLRNASDGTPLGENLDFYRQVPLNTRAYAQGLALLLLTEEYKNMN